MRCMGFAQTQPCRRPERAAGTPAQPGQGVIEAACCPGPSGPPVGPRRRPARGHAVEARRQSRGLVLVGISLPLSSD